MHARIARVQLIPGTEDDALRAIKVQGVVAFESVDGFDHLAVYLNREGHTGVLVTHWDTREHALAAGSAKPVRDLLERVQRMIASPPVIEIFELAFST